MAANSEGKVVGKVFIPKDRVLIKEECHCRPGMVHWNLILESELGQNLIETFLYEKDIDYVMSKLRVELKR